MANQVRGVAWESAVVVRVPSLDGTISALRRRFALPHKPNGIPPHITAIVPFLPAAELAEDGSAVQMLRTICAAAEPFRVTFSRTGRFPHVLYLAPEPADPFVDLAGAITASWPAVKPYAGEHKTVVPHLTVATSRPQTVFDTVDRALRPQLPVTAEIDGAQVYLFDGERWREHAALPFARRTAR